LNLIWRISGYKSCGASLRNVQPSEKGHVVHNGFSGPKEHMMLSFKNIPIELERKTLLFRLFFLSSWVPIMIPFASMKLSRQKHHKQQQLLYALSEWYHLDTEVVAAELLKLGLGGPGSWVRARAACIPSSSQNKVAR
jgi:hypothetical protein